MLVSVEDRCEVDLERVRVVRVAEWERRNKEVCEGVQARVGCAKEDSAVTAREVTWACECSSGKGQESTVRDGGRAGEQHKIKLAPVAGAKDAQS